MKRVEKSLSIVIRALPEYILQLTCPVEELKWIPGWQYDLIYSKSGVNKTNCIFREEMSGPHFFSQTLKTTWVTVIHHPEAGLILFHLNLSDKACILFEFTCREIESAVSACTWHMTFTALDGEVDAMPDNIIKEKLELMIAFLSDALKHYCQTGKMLK